MTSYHRYLDFPKEVLKKSIVKKLEVVKNEVYGTEEKKK